ncbi:MAG TPA: fasciclin domain-containing protein [Phycisphaerae bacterium]|nr:fasciclin domain-containing protein [Phycisphaerae bacterium]
MLVKRLSTMCLGVIVLTMAINGCQKQTAFNVNIDTTVHSVYGVWNTNPDYSTFVHLMEVAKFDDPLQMPGAYTIFAPTNEAFNKLPPGTIDMLEQPDESEKLRNLLWYHIAIYTLDPAYVAKYPVVQMGNQDNAYVVSNGSTFLTINNANVVAGPIVTRNATIYGIDEVIIPQNPGYPGY